MAGAPIEIGIASETKAFRQGVQTGIIDPLEDAADKLDDLGKSKGPEKLERELEQAQKATKDLGREVDRTADDIEDEFKRAYRKAGDSADDFHDRASENVEGFKSEAIQNLSEVASSFDGDLTDMADGVQGLTGGLASSLTPGVGIPVAILGAAAGAFLASWAESTEETKQLIDDMYRDMIESGQAFLSEDFINKALADIIGDSGKVAKAREDAKKFGVDVQTVLRAQAGDQAAINEVIAAGNDKRQRALDLVAEETRLQGDVYKGQALINGKWDEALKTYTDLNGAAAQTVEQVNLYREATNNAASADQKRYEALARHLAGLPAEKTIGINLDTSPADASLQKWLTGSRRVLEVKLQAKDRYGREI